MSGENTGAFFAAEIFAAPGKAHAGWIARARAAARRIAAEKGEVTINDVRAVCPPPEDADPRIMGAVLSRNEYVRTGFAVSQRRDCHGRMIGVFRLRPGSAGGERSGEP
jgi:hypothetical protein